MNVLLDEDTKQVQQAIADFLQGECTIARVRAAEKIATRIDQNLWENFAELGWLGLCLPESCGGQALPLDYLGVLFEELGRFMAPIPVHASLVPAVVLARHGTSDHQQLLADVVRGRVILCHAVHEKAGEWGAGAIQLTARVEGDELVLRGAKSFVDYFEIAAKCLVVAKLQDPLKPGRDRLCVVLLDTTAQGLRCERLSPMAKDQQSIVYFDDVHVPAESLVGGGPAAAEDLMDLSSVLMAAQMQGAARKAMELAVAYVNGREAFGQPIGAFQAIQHMAADMVNSVDATQLLVREAIWRMGEGLPFRIEVSQAKSFANERCLMVCRCAQQMHGGIGFIEEFDINLWYRRVTSWALRAGTTYEHRSRIAAALLDQPGTVRLGMVQDVAPNSRKEIA